jgi:hypothetical protein
LRKEGHSTVFKTIDPYIQQPNQPLKCSESSTITNLIRTKLAPARANLNSTSIERHAQQIDKGAPQALIDPTS